MLMSLSLRLHSSVRLKSHRWSCSSIVIVACQLCVSSPSNRLPSSSEIFLRLDMSETPIRLRDSPAQVQEKLGLSNREFDNFKNFARRVHGEYCAARPSSKWADVNIVWTAVPEREKLDVIQLMYNLCVESRLFPPTTRRTTIEAGIEQRLHQVRRTWQQTSRTRTRPSAPGDD